MTTEATWGDSRSWAKDRVKSKEEGQKYCEQDYIKFTAVFKPSFIIYI